MYEFNEMERWRAFAAKLNDEEFRPMDETTGKVRGWNPAERINLCEPAEG